MRVSATSPAWEKSQQEMLHRNLGRAPERNAHYDQVAEMAFGLFGLDGRVLDVGCGTGWSRRLISDALEYHGIDPAYPLPGQDIGCGYGMGEEIPFGAARFDSVLCYSVLQHVEDPRKILREIERVLVPDGKLGILVCVESEDPLFLQRWNREQAVNLIEERFDIRAFAAIPGFCKEDGFHLAVLGRKR